MMWNVTLCRQLVFEDAIEAESEEEAVEIAMERNGYDDLNWRRNGPTQVVCVGPVMVQSLLKCSPRALRNWLIRRNGRMMKKAWSGRWIKADSRKSVRSRVLPIRLVKRIVTPTIIILLSLRYYWAKILLSLDIASASVKIQNHARC